MDRSAAADYLGISERSIQRHKDNGDLPFHRLGGLIRYLRADLDEFPVRFERKKVSTKNRKAALRGSSRQWPQKGTLPRHPSLP